VFTADAAKCFMAELFVETAVHILNYSQDNSDFTNDQYLDFKLFTFFCDIINLERNSDVLCICQPVNVFRLKTVCYYRNIKEISKVEHVHSECTLVYGQTYSNVAIHDVRIWKGR